MCTYLILVDSTTRGTDTSKYGKSTVCWFVYREELKGMPLRVGAIYCDYNEGPNKIFYVGVIRALEDCFFLCGTDNNIKIMGDCEHAIGQLNSDIDIDDLEPFYKQVKGLEKKYERYGKGPIKYEYLGEKDAAYRKLDRCVKQFQNYLEQRIIGQHKKKKH